MKFNIRRLTRLSMMAAVLCVIAPLRLDIGPVPLTLQTFAVALAGAFLGAVDGTIAVAVYLLLGLAGLPVFSGFLGGFGHFIGPTGGFLVGFVPLAALCGMKRWWWALPGLAATYALGTIWFMHATGMALGASLSVAVWPFVIKDVASVLLAFLLGRTLKKRLPA